MSQVRELLIEELLDLLHAENQIVAALPKMTEAANNDKLKEAFQSHLKQTKGQIDRLEQACELLGVPAKPKPCKGMKGLLEEGQDTIEDGEARDGDAADLALIAAAQKVEHYEISAYGTARTLARQIREIDVAILLEHSLGEEECSDHLLTTIAKPLLQRVTEDDLALAGSTPARSSGTSRKPSSSKSAKDL